MWWNGRVYFISDRDGTMNIWSMDEGGGDARQHTRHSGWDVKDASIGQGRIVFQVAADLWIFDTESGQERMVAITLASDLDQLRERWVSKPMDFLTSVHLHPSGASVVLTSRGRVFVAPASDGRLVRASNRQGVRYRDAVFMPDGRTLLALSDATGELEFETLPANGVGEPEPMTNDGRILRFSGHPSPDGKWVAYSDNNNDLWLLEMATKSQKLVSTNREGVANPAWSPDSRWLAWSQTGLNTYQQILLYDVETQAKTPLTSDRVNSTSASWSPDGRWIYFLSDRNLQSVVGAPWGARQPGAFFDKPMKLYHVSLQAGTRSPFRPPNELEQEDTGTEREKEPAAGSKAGGTAREAASGTRPAPVKIDLQGIGARVREVPVPAGDYRGLEAGATALFYLSRDPGAAGRMHLIAMEIGSKGSEAKKLVEDVRYYELSLDRKKLLVHRRDEIFVIDAGTTPPAAADMAKKKIDLGAWTFPIDIRDDWRQIFVDAWRLERDYFYDPGMHGVDWDDVLKKHLPLVDRVTTRDELNDLIGRVVGELSALHTSVGGGDLRDGPDDIRVPTLGARLARDERAGGYRIEYIYRTDPDYPDERSPLADPDLRIGEGDVIQAVNGVDVLSEPHPHLNSLLRNQQNRQVLLRIKPASGAGSRDVIVVPTTWESRMRYDDWQHTRRMAVEERGGGRLGYIHLKAMGGTDLNAWYRQFYPVFDRQGLVIDVRHNRGGNIDSMILEKLLRQAWFYWKDRARAPYWNMQYAFRGHIVVLCDEDTASDGEAFAEGFKRLGLGKLIGTRTWGGEIWLSSSNRLSDGGLARAPMMGVYGPEGEWLIEGHGVEPDVLVENLPHSTFNGEDAQLDAAIAHLLDEIGKDPRPVPAPPPYPDKSFKYPGAASRR
jgi:tricorn protease